MYAESDLLSDCTLVLDGIPVQEEISPFVHYHVNNLQYLEGVTAALLAEKTASVQQYRKTINASILSANNESNTTVIDTWDQQKHTVESLEKHDVAVPLRYQCSDLSHGCGSENSSKDSSLKQLKRDLERDKVSINGLRISGSEVGMDSIVKIIEKKIMEILRVAQFPPIEKAVLKSLVMEILRKGSRTNSGYLCYENIQQMIDETKTMLVPLSTLAKPIAISLSIGGLSETSHWGLLCSISCLSFFHVVSSAEHPSDGTEGQEKVVIVGVYEQVLLLKLNVGSKYSAVDMSSLMGKSSVTIQRHVITPEK